MVVSQQQKAIQRDARPCTSSLKSKSTLQGTSPKSFVPCSIRFNGLADQAGLKVREPTAEEVIDHYYHELVDTDISDRSNHPNSDQPKSSPKKAISTMSNTTFNQQIHDYRAKQTSKFKKGSANSIHVTLLGDSMVKRINGQKLSQSKVITVISRPGATIEDLSTKIMDGSIRLPTSELIIHVGTNNNQDDAETISKKLESLCEMHGTGEIYHP